MTSGVADDQATDVCRHRLQLMDIPEAAAILKVSESWLAHRVAANEVPHTRLGRSVRFSERHLREIIARGETRRTQPARRRRQASSRKPTDP